jgi:hypothetical protein
MSKVTGAVNSPPPAVATLVAAVVAVASLLLTQHYISNQTEQLIAGLASILIPAVYPLAVGHQKQANARIEAAQIVAPKPLEPVQATAGEMLGSATVHIDADVLPLRDALAKAEADVEAAVARMEAQLAKVTLPTAKPAPKRAAARPAKTRAQGKT